MFRASNSSGFRLSNVRGFSRVTVLGTFTSRKNVGGSIERSIVGLFGRFLGSMGLQHHPARAKWSNRFVVALLLRYLAFALSVIECCILLFKTIGSKCEDHRIKV